MDFEQILNLGVEKEIINETQKNGLIDLLNQNNDEPKQLSTVVKVFYYIGGFIMLCAMVYLMSNTIQHSTYAVILSLGSLYAVLFLGIGEFLWRKNEKFPAGILYFLFIAAFGLIVMDIEKMTGFFPHFSDMDKIPNFSDLCRLPMLVLSVLTIIANSVLQKFRKVSFLALPTIFCSYAIYVIIIDYIFGIKKSNHIIDICNLIFATGLIIVAFIKDRLTKVDYSKWMYFFGAIGIFISLFSIIETYYPNLDTWKFELISFILSTIYIFVGLLIQRKTFSIIGILGVIEYIMYLEINNIKNNETLLTSVILVTGLIILCTGVLYNKNVDKIENFIESILPQVIRKYLPQNRT